VVKFAASGAQWTANHMTDWLHRPQPSGNWFVPIYQRMMTIGAILLLPFLLLAIFDAIRFGDLGMLVKAVAIWLPLAVVLTMAAVGIAQAGMAVTDELTDYVFATPGVNMTAFFSKLAGLFGALLALAATMAMDGFAPGAAVAFGAALARLGAGVGLFIELVIRQAAIYASLLFLPLAFAGTVWPSARGWARLLVRLLFVAIVSKFVIASVLVLGVAALRGRSGVSGGDVLDRPCEPDLAAGRRLTGGAAVQSVVIVHRLSDPEAARPPRLRAGATGPRPALGLRDQGDLPPGAGRAAAGARPLPAERARDGDRGRPAQGFGALEGGQPLVPGRARAQRLGAGDHVDG
jgi:hypothetical protein